MEAINLILAKMEGYKICLDHYNHYDQWYLSDELGVLREFCKSQEQFIQVLKVYDGGRYCYKNGELIDRENPPSDYDSDSDDDA